MEFSELPEDIIHRIIINHLLRDPALTNKTAVRFSLLSKEIFKGVRTSRPTLSFVWPEYFPHPNDPHPNMIRIRGWIWPEHDPHPRLDLENRLLQEFGYVLSTLKQHTHLETFAINAVSLSYSAGLMFICTRIYECVELAVANNRGLKNLTITVAKKIMWEFGYPPIILPQPVLKAESLVHLHSEQCELHAAESVIITWPNLKRLRLRGVYIGKGVFENIILGCPLIESMTISDCKFFFSNYHIKVSNLGYLKELDVSLTYSQTLEVDSPLNLETLTCYSTNWASPTSPFDFGEHEYPKLRSLTVSYLGGYKHSFPTNISGQFPQLERFDAQERRGIVKKISISSSSLKKICLGYIRGLEEATFDVPNILDFEYQGYDFPKLSFAGNSSGWISRFVFNISSNKLDSSMFLKLKRFSAALKIPTTSTRVSFTGESVVFKIQADHPQMSADSVAVQGINVRHLIISRTYYSSYYENQRKFSLSFAKKFLDTMLLIYCPQSITLEDWHDCKFPKLLYDYLMVLTRFRNDHQFTGKVTEIHVPPWVAKECRTWNKGLKQVQVSQGNNFVFELDYQQQMNENRVVGALRFFRFFNFNLKNLLRRKSDMNCSNFRNLNS